MALGFRVRGVRLLAVGGVLAGGMVVPGALAQEEREVRLYTNADLERFEVLPDSAVEVERPSAEEMQVVADFLRESYDRIEARRTNDLERRRALVEIEAIEAETGRDRAYLPFNYYPYGWERAVPYYDYERRDRGRAFPGRRPLSTGGAIRPLHAGPTLSQVQWHRATRRSGVAAFPSNARARLPRTHGRR